jgi:hypothetical protein
MLYLEHVKQEIQVRELLTTLDELDSRVDEEFVFEKTGDGWRPLVA